MQSPLINWWAMFKNIMFYFRNFKIHKLWDDDKKGKNPLEQQLEGIKAQQKEYGQKKDEIEEGIKQTKEALTVYNTKLAELQGKQLPEVQKQLNGVEAQIAGHRAQIESLEDQLLNPDLTEQQKEQVNEQLRQYKESLKQLVENQAYLEDQLNQINGAIDYYKQHIDQAQNQLQNLQTQLTQIIATNRGLQAQLNAVAGVIAKQNLAQVNASKKNAKIAVDAEQSGGIG